MITNDSATYARALAKIELLHVHDAARKQSSILTHFNQKQNTNYCKKYQYIFSLLLHLRLTKVNTEVNIVLGLPNAL